MNRLQLKINIISCQNNTNRLFLLKIYIKIRQKNIRKNYNSWNNLSKTLQKNMIKTYKSNNNFNYIHNNNMRKIYKFWKNLSKLSKKNKLKCRIGGNFKIIRQNILKNNSK